MKLEDGKSYSRADGTGLCVAREEDPGSEYPFALWFDGNAFPHWVTAEGHSILVGGEPSYLSLTEEVA